MKASAISDRIYLYFMFTETKTEQKTEDSEDYCFVTCSMLRYRPCYQSPGIPQWSLRGKNVQTRQEKCRREPDTP